MEWDWDKKTRQVRNKSKARAGQQMIHWKKYQFENPNGLSPVLDSRLMEGCLVRNAELEWDILIKNEEYDKINIQCVVGLNVRDVLEHYITN